MGNKIYSYAQLEEFWAEINDNDIISGGIEGQPWEQLNKDVVVPALEAMLTAAGRVLDFPKVHTLSSGSNIISLRDGAILDLRWVRWVSPMKKESKGTNIISYYMVMFSDGWQMRIENENMPRNIFIDRLRGAE